MMTLSVPKYIALTSLSRIELVTGLKSLNKLITTGYRSFCKRLKKIIGIGLLKSGFRLDLGIIIDRFLNQASSDARSALLLGACGR